MGLDICKDKEGVKMCILLWKEIDYQLNVLLESVVKDDVSIKPKLVAWNAKFKTNFHGADIPFNYSVKTTTILKIEKVYKQGEKYYLQIFVKECKIIEGNTSAKSFLDGFDTCPILVSWKEHFNFFDRSIYKKLLALY